MPTAASRPFSGDTPPSRRLARFRSRPPGMRIEGLRQARARALVAVAVVASALLAVVLAAASATAAAVGYLFRREWAREADAEVRRDTRRYVAAIAAGVATGAAGVGILVRASQSGMSPASPAALLGVLLLGAGAAVTVFACTGGIEMLCRLRASWDVQGGNHGGGRD